MASKAGRGPGRVTVKLSEEEECFLEDIKDETSFSTDNPGEFQRKGRVEKYGTAATAQYPQQPLYSIGEVVYIVSRGQTQPAGPYVISKILQGPHYKLKRQEDGQEHPSAIAEDQLVVSTSTGT